MSKLVLYIYDGGELEDIIEGVPRIKKYLDKYENNSKGSAKKVGGDSSEAQCPTTDS